MLIGTSWFLAQVRSVQVLAVRMHPLMLVDQRTNSTALTGLYLVTVAGFTISLKKIELEDMIPSFV